MWQLQLLLNKAILILLQNRVSYLPFNNQQKSDDLAEEIGLKVRAQCQRLKNCRALKPVLVALQLL